jgi:branched-chain amino acid transport system ATP-binding protein
MSGPPMNIFFKAERLLKRFGGLVAVDDFSIRIEPGDLVGLIGPNGAGKTTVFNLIAGATSPDGGRIIWRDEDITGKPVHRITACGIARTFQNIRLFTNMSVLENVMVSFHHKIKAHFWDAMLGLPAYGREERRIREESLDLLRELDLADAGSERAGSLPYGRQRRLEIARALATRPGLLLLDEPAAGMNPRETFELADLLLELRSKYQLAILLIEHDMNFVMRVCERIKVLDYGVTIAEGSPSEIQSSAEVIKAYLGDVRHAQAE